jgi:hypothetical protein
MEADMAPERAIPGQACSGCGLEVPNGSTGCQSIMDELLALHFGNPVYFSVHRLFVDTYCLQHPGGASGTRRGKSLGRRP